MLGIAGTPRSGSRCIPMYAFVVMVLLNGAPQFVILERGLSASECQAMSERPDSGLSIDGQPVAGIGRCVLEEEIPDDVNGTLW